MKQDTIEDGGRLCDLVTDTERKLSKVTGATPEQHVWEDKRNPVRYLTDLIEIGVPRNLAEVETAQYEKLYNHIKRYIAIDIEMRSYQKPVYNKKKKGKGHK